MRYCTIILIVVLVISGGAVAVADTAIPGSTEYMAEVTDDHGEKSCALNILLLHPVDPEFVQSIALFAIPKRRELPTLALLVQAGEVVRTNGKPLEKRKATLRSASFASAQMKFDLAPFKEGGMIAKIALGTIDPTSIGRFLKPFTAGQFQLTLSREDRPAARTYHVSKEPPSDVKTKLLECEKIPAR